MSATEASIRKGKGIVANPEFIISFGLSAIFAVVGATTILASWLDYAEANEVGQHAFEGVRLWAVGLMVGLGVLAGAAIALERMGHGAEALLTGLVAFLGLLAGIAAVLTLFLLWGSPAEAGWMGVHGFDNPLVGAAIALFLIIMAPAAIYGESILPIFIAFIAGVWGILSIIVFVMVILGIGGA